MVSCASKTGLLSSTARVSRNETSSPVKYRIELQPHLQNSDVYYI